MSAFITTKTLNYFRSTRTPDRVMHLYSEICRGMKVKSYVKKGHNFFLEVP